MKTIIAIIFFLAAAMAQGEELQTGESPTQLQVEAVEHQLVQGGLGEKEARTLTKAMVEAKFTERHMVQFGKQIPSGKNQQIATGAMRDKVHEGIAKGAPPEAIVKATERVRNRYQHAMHLAEELEPVDKKKQLQLGGAYTDCLVAGLTRQDARTVQNALKERTRTSAKAGQKNHLNAETLLTARDMVRQGISSKSTTDLLCKALERGYDENGMRTLRHTFRNRKAENLEKTAKQYQLAIERGVQARGLKNYSYSGGAIKGASPNKGGTQNNGSSGGSSGSGSSGGSEGSGSGGSGGNGGSGSGGSEGSGGSGSGGSGGSEGSGSGGSGGSEGGGNGGGGNS